MPIVATADRRFDVDVVVFDKDGTLVDLDAVWFPPAKGWVDAVASDDADLATAIAGRLGIDLVGGRLVPDSIAAASTFERIGAVTRAELTDRSWPHDRIAAALERASAAVDHALRSAQPQLLADLPQLFGRLVAGGVRLAVLTSDDRQSTEEFLHRVGVGQLLAMVVTATDVDHPKPDADGLLRIVRGLAVPADRILMIGDSVFDREAARAAGSWFVAVGHRSSAAHGADATVDCIDELTVG